jgi:hypothetical protein
MVKNCIKMLYEICAKTDTNKVEISRSSPFTNVKRTVKNQAERWGHVTWEHSLENATAGQFKHRPAAMRSTPQCELYQKQMVAAHAYMSIESGHIRHKILAMTGLSSVANNTCKTKLLSKTLWPGTLDAAWASRRTVNVSLYCMKNGFVISGTVHW